MNDSMTYLNQIYFQNNAVLSMDPQFLYINVNLIPSTMLIDGRLVSYVVPAAGHTVYYPNGQALVYTRSGREVPVSGPGVAVQPAYAETYYPPAHVRPVDPIDPIRRGVIVPDPKPNSTGIRTMVVTIPEGTIGGTVLTVQAPDGTQVQVQTATLFLIFYRISHFITFYQKHSFY